MERSVVGKEGEVYCRILGYVAGVQEENVGREDRSLRDSDSDGMREERFDRKS